RPTDQRHALLVKVLRLLPAQFRGLLENQRPRVFGPQGTVKELVDGAQVDGHGKHFAVVGRVDPVLIARERRELIDVVPHALVRGVEEVGAVAVNLNAGRRLVLTVSIAADVMPTIYHEHLHAELRSQSFGNGETEK